MIELLRLVGFDVFRTSVQFADVQLSVLPQILRLLLGQDDRWYQKHNSPTFFTECSVIILPSINCFVNRNDQLNYLDD